MDDGVPVLEAKGVSKRFGAVTALRDAALTVRRGEVVALMGANGAGKSTFVKILTGALRRDGGEVRVHGTPRAFASPAGARASGIVSVYQEPALIPDLDVADNLRLGDTPEETFLHWVPSRRRPTAARRSPEPSRTPRARPRARPPTPPAARCRWRVQSG
jgi:ribose transport system ATP-binding protein